MDDRRGVGDRLLECPEEHRNRAAQRGEERRAPWRRVILFVKILEALARGGERDPNSGLTVSQDSLVFLPACLRQSVPRVPGEKIQERLFESRRRER